MVSARERATSVLNEDALRSAALRELSLARGLLACGDADGFARRLLKDYARDLRGVFARHAREVLKAGVARELVEIACLERAQGAGGFPGAGWGPFPG